MYVNVDINLFSYCTVAFPRRHVIASFPILFSLTLVLYVQLSTSLSELPSAVLSLQPLLMHSDMCRTLAGV